MIIVENRFELYSPWKNCKERFYKPCKSSVDQLHPNFDMLPTRDKFVSILRSQNRKVILAVAEYINKAMKKGTLTPWNSLFK